MLTSFMETVLESICVNHSLRSTLINSPYGVSENGRTNEAGSKFSMVCWRNSDDDVAMVCARR